MSYEQVHFFFVFLFMEFQRVNRQIKDKTMLARKKKSYGINKAFGGKKNIKLNWLDDSLLLSALLDTDISLFVSLCFWLSSKQDTHKQSNRATETQTGSYIRISRTPVMSCKSSLAVSSLSPSLPLPERSSKSVAVWVCSLRFVRGVRPRGRDRFAMKKII